MAMTNKEKLTSARDDMLAVLDERLSKMPEWRAFRAMEEALAAINETTAAPVRMIPKVPPRGQLRPAEGPTYVQLALEAIKESGAPLSTTDILDFIAKRRALSSDPEKARIDVESGLSRDERIKNIVWHASRAWWPADRELPNANSASTGVTP